jgi:hypothetical protein
MPGESVQIGPFTGGLNAYSDISAIQDNELSICENFDLDFDGSLLSRPPYVDRSITMPLNSAGGNPSLLGYYYNNGAAYLIASDGYSNTYFFDGTSWTSIFTSGFGSKFAATAMAQYDGKAWLLSDKANSTNGGYWVPGGTNGTFTAVADLPHGNTIVSFKNRLWVSAGQGATSGATTIYYSNIIGSATLWPTISSTINYFQVGAGDGQDIVRLVAYSSALLIFKQNTIYSHQYDSSPDLGFITIVSPTTGLDHRNALTIWENYIYFTYDNRAFEMMNNRAVHINMKVPFETDSTTGFDVAQARAVSLFDSRILFSFFDRQYVFSLRTRTWSIWKSPSRGPIGQVIITTNHTNSEDAVCIRSSVVTGGTRTMKTLYLTDGYTTETETFTCTAQTKNFNYKASSAYKRLFWWGIDAVFKGTVTGSAIPITYSQAVLWSQITGLTWSYMANYTWGQPTSPSTTVDTVVNSGGALAIRKFVKFMKALRFRQIRYKIVFNTDGSNTTGPVRLFNIVTYVRAHEHAVKSVS